MDVGEWLRGLGLGRYETVFREHAIDMDVLVDLTDGELAQIGVPLGDRKRLFKVIASLFETEPSPSSKEECSSGRSQPARESPMLLARGKEAERRPVAVMLCDLVGSPFQLRSTPRIGAIWSAPTSTLRRRRRRKWADASPWSSATGSWRCSDTRSRRRTIPNAPVRAALAIQRALAELNRESARSSRPSLSLA